jgi:hypothetical protein
VIGRIFKTCLVASLAATILKTSSVALASGPTTTITLAWDPSPDPNVVGYRLYQGTVSLDYTTVVDIGNNTTAVVPGLVPGAVYFFAVTAYDANNVESPFSGEIAYTVPASAPPAPGFLAPLSILWYPGGPIVLIATGPAGHVYDVYASEDFSSWSTIGSVMVDTNGLLQFTDQDSILLPTRYYRLHETTQQP